MLHFDRKTLNHLKKLCRIECTEDEELDLIHSLNRVLDYMTELQKVNTDGVESCNYVLRNMLKNPLREDAVFDLMPREQFLANAPDQIGGMIRVPPVLKPSE